MKKIDIAIIAILVWSLAVPALAEPPVLQCPTEPPSVRRLELVERWRIDPNDSDAPILGYFDQAQILVHQDKVYMMDRQLCHILVYGKDGAFEGTIMQEGDGPGEVRDPGPIFLCSDGRIAVQNGYPTRLEFVDLDGTPRGRWRVESNAWVNRIQETPGGWFAVYMENKQSDEPGEYYSIFHAALHDDEGRLTDSFHDMEIRGSHWEGSAKSEAEEHNPWYSAVAVGSGKVVFAPARDEYRLEWRNLAGETTLIVTRDFEAHERTQAELDEMKYRSYSIVNDNIKFKDLKLCPRDPMIRTLEPLKDGTLRVRTSTFEKDMPEKMVCRFELHEPTGELRERVEIYDPTGGYDVEYDVIALLDNGGAMILRNLRPAFRAAIDSRLHPEVLEKMPPPPDDREDIAFTPIYCDLVPR